MYAYHPLASSPEGPQSSSTDLGRRFFRLYTQNTIHTSHLLEYSMMRLAIVVIQVCVRQSLALSRCL